MAITTYDPTAYDLLIDGVPADQFADGTFIKVQYTSPINNTKTGAKGDSTFLKQSDPTGTMTFRLKQTSLMNVVLATAALTDRATTGGIPAFAVMLVDVQGLPVASGTAKIGKAAERSFMGGSNNRDEPVCEWELAFGYLAITA